MSNKLQPDPAAEGITEWPHRQRGVLEIVDCGGFEDPGSPSAWALAQIDTDDGNEGIPFGFDGAVLRESGLSFEEVDGGISVDVWVEPSDDPDQFGLSAEDGQMTQWQIYKAVRIRRPDNG